MADLEKCSIKKASVSFTSRFEAYMNGRLSWRRYVADQRLGKMSILHTVPVALDTSGSFHLGEAERIEGLYAVSSPAAVLLISRFAMCH